MTQPHSRWTEEVYDPATGRTRRVVREAWTVDRRAQDRLDAVLLDNAHRRYERLTGAMHADSLPDAILSVLEASNARDARDRERRRRRGERG